MRAIIQRVKKAALTADGVPHGEMGAGILVLVGVHEQDDQKVMKYMLDKMVNLRIFEDENGKMNLSIKDLGLSLFLVPNFTLYGDCRHGRRPSYTNGAPVAVAEGIFNAFAEYAKANAGVHVETGVFQAEMHIETELDGPVTLMLDSEKLF